MLRRSERQGVQRLVAAMIREAIRDTRSKNDVTRNKALLFLHNHNGSLQEWLEMAEVDVSPDYIRRQAGISERPA